MIYRHKNIPDLLREELAHRQQKNSAYSMRAFARDLDVSAPHLSQILKGTKSLSQTSAHKITDELGLGADEKVYFDLLLHINRSNSDSEKQDLEQSAHQIRERHSVKVQEADQLNLIRDWYHIPILEMIYLDDFEYKVESLAARLGIPDIVCDMALSRLCRLGLLKLKDGKYHKSETNVVFRSPKRHEAFQKFHEQMIEKAKESIDRKAIEERVIMSQTFCMDKELIDEAKETTREFIRKMTDLFTKSKKRDEIYQLNVQFFDLSEPNQSQTTLGKEEVE